MFHQKRIRRIKAESKKGASLVIVVCVSAFLVAFALAMVYTAGLMLSQANQRLKQERSYQLARSFAETLDEELSRFTKPQDADADSFYLFACRFLELRSYADYNPDYPESTIFHYSAGDWAEKDNYGEITVALYKENDWDGRQAFFYSGDSGNAGYPANVAGNIARYTFTVEVTARVDNVSYSYSTVYNQSANYGPENLVFYKDGSRIYWNSASAEWQDSTGNVLPIVENDEIEYDIRPVTTESDFNFLKTYTGEYTFKKMFKGNGET